MNISKQSLTISSFDYKTVSERVKPSLVKMAEIFKRKVRIYNKIHPKVSLETESIETNDVDGRGLSIIFNVNSSSVVLDWNTDEGYVLDVKSADSKNILAEIDAETIYGARHALETLSQLISSLPSTAEDTT